jgi:uroporphyrin-III C-methyltransferase
MTNKPDPLLSLLRRPRGNGPRVYLIGAGPGNPELLTLGAVARLRSADVVLYDRLVSEEVLALASPIAELIYVGKRCGDHSLPQRDIESLLIEKARSGKYVARLKGGDPFIFGRGGEEVQALTAAGIEVEVIPGISAANGCAAYAGIPLTHRDYAQACLFVTAQGKEGADIQHWQALVQPRQTVVVYMGLGSLDSLCGGLIANGLPTDWPVAVVEKGTRADQRVLTGTLSDIGARVREVQLQGPALTIVGEVVKLAKAQTEPADAARERVSALPS